jgi:hypothetical protein
VSVPPVSDAVNTLSCGILAGQRPRTGERLRAIADCARGTVRVGCLAASVLFHVGTSRSRCGHSVVRPRPPRSFLCPRRSTVAAKPEAVAAPAPGGGSDDQRGCRGWRGGDFAGRPAGRSSDHRGAKAMEAAVCRGRELRIKRSTLGDRITRADLPQRGDRRRGGDRKGTGVQGETGPNGKRFVEASGAGG